MADTLLPLDFPYFSWEEQIGNATYEELQSSFNTLAHKGRTNLFRLVVWNDFVDLLYRALTESGYSWDNTYRTYEQTKMTLTSGELSSFRFNSVCKNIEQVCGDCWRWAVLPSFEGYLSRSKIIGASQVGEEKADKVYSSYILEVVRKLNVLIAILKGEADFAEFLPQARSKTTANTLLRSNKSAPMQFKKSSLTNTIVTALSRASRPMYISLYSRTNSDTEVCLMPPRILEAGVKDESLINVILSPKIRAKLDYVETSKTPHIITARSLGAKKLDIVTNSHADFILDMKNPKMASGEYKAVSNTIHEIDLKNPKAQAMVYANSALSSGNVELNIPIAMSVYAENTATSSNFADVLVGRPLIISDSEEISHSFNIAITDTVTPIHLTSTKEISNTFEQAVMDKVNFINLGGAQVESKTKSSVYLTFDIVEDAWAKQNGDNLFIYQVYDGYKEESELYIDTEYWLAPIQNGTDLFIRQLYDNNEVKGE